MGKKNTFNPLLIKKDKQYDKLKHKNTIEWLKPSTYNIEDYVDALRKLRVPTEIEDHELFVLDNYLSYTIIAQAEINLKLKVIKGSESKNQYLYFLTDKEYTVLYICLQVCHPAFWYKYDNRKDFLDIYDDLYDSYNKTEYILDYPCSCRGFIGTEKMLEVDIETLENHFILNKYTEVLLWGSKWKDNPFRETYINNKVPTKQHVVYASHAMKQVNDETYTANVRAEFSKCILSVENHDSAYILEARYTPIKSPQIEIINKILDREYPTDIPVDIIISVINLPYLTYMGLLKLYPLGSYNFILSSLIANTPEMSQNIIDETRKILKEDVGKENKKDNHTDSCLDDETREYAIHFLKNMECNKKIDIVLHSNGVLNLIDAKLQEITDGKIVYEDVQEEVDKKIDDTMKLLKMKDDEFKTYFQGIIASILRREP